MSILLVEKEKEYAENREKEIIEIHKNLSLVASNKFNSSQSKMIFIGISFDIILSKILFINNSDLKPFIEKHFIVHTKEKEILKDYLYASRTALLARLSRMIYEEMDYTSIIQISKGILEDFPKIESKKKSKNQILTESGTEDWMNYISKDENNE